MEQYECGCCQKDVENLFWCSKCMKIMYCSAECQLADWKEHKAQCKQIEAKILRKKEEIHGLRAPFDIEPGSNKVLQKLKNFQAFERDRLYADDILQARSLLSSKKKKFFVQPSKQERDQAKNAFENLRKALEKSLKQFVAAPKKDTLGSWRTEIACAKYLIKEIAVFVGKEEDYQKKRMQTSAAERTLHESAQREKLLMLSSMVSSLEQRAFQSGFLHLQIFESEKDENTRAKYLVELSKEDTLSEMDQLTYYPLDHFFDAKKEYGKEKMAEGYAELKKHAALQSNLVQLRAELNLLDEKSIFSDAEKQRLQREVDVFSSQEAKEALRKIDLVNEKHAKVSEIEQKMDAAYEIVARLTKQLFDQQDGNEDTRTKAKIGVKLSEIGNQQQQDMQTESFLSLLAHELTKQKKDFVLDAVTRQFFVKTRQLEVEYYKKTVGSSIDGEVRREAMRSAARSVALVLDNIKDNETLKDVARRVVVGLLDNDEQAVRVVRAATKKVEADAKETCWTFTRHLLFSLLLIAGTFPTVGGVEDADVIGVEHGHVAEIVNFAATDNDNITATQQHFPLSNDELQQVVSIAQTRQLTDEELVRQYPALQQAWGKVDVLANEIVRLQNPGLFKDVQKDLDDFLTTLESAMKAKNGNEAAKVFAQTKSILETSLAQTFDSLRDNVRINVDKAGILIPEAEKLEDLENDRKKLAEKASDFQYDIAKLDKIVDADDLQTFDSKTDEFLGLLTKFSSAIEKVQKDMGERVSENLRSYLKSSLTRQDFNIGTFVESLSARLFDVMVYGDDIPEQKVFDSYPASQEKVKQVLYQILPTALKISRESLGTQSLLLPKQELFPTVPTSIQKDAQRKTDVIQDVTGKEIVGASTAAYLAGGVLYLAIVAAVGKMWQRLTGKKDDELQNVATSTATDYASISLNVADRYTQRILQLEKKIDAAYAAASTSSASPQAFLAAKQEQLLALHFTEQKMRQLQFVAVFGDISKSTGIAQTVFPIVPTIAGQTAMWAWWAYSAGSAVQNDSLHIHAQENSLHFVKFTLGWAALVGSVLVVLEKQRRRAVHQAYMLKESSAIINQVPYDIVRGRNFFSLDGNDIEAFAEQKTSQVQMFPILVSAVSTFLLYNLLNVPLYSGAGVANNVLAALIAGSVEYMN